MKAFYLKRLLFLLLINFVGQQINAQRTFTLIAGVNGGILDLQDELMQKNYNVCLGTDLFESKLRVGFKYGRYFTSSFFTDNDFTVSSLFIQGGFRPIDRIRLLFEVTGSIGDYGIDLNYMPFTVSGTKYIGVGGGIEIKIFELLHFSTQLNTMVSVFHGMEYPPGFNRNIPNANLGFLFLL